MEQTEQAAVPGPCVLVLDEDVELARAVAAGLEEHGYRAWALGSGHKAMEWLARRPYDALVTELRISGAERRALLAAALKQSPERPVLVMTAPSAADSAIECIRQGAYHYLIKPFKLDELVLFLQRALDEARLRREARLLQLTLRERYSQSSLIGSSAAMRALRALLETIADTDTPVLLRGEPGTGKGLVARILHVDSRRASGPLVTVNCAAIPESLLESELFGQTRDALASAAAGRQGLLAAAEGGTLFLDEVGELPLPLQTKLLHVLERAPIHTVGPQREQRADVRIVAATHRDLHVAVRQRLFLGGLLNRLAGVSIELPALRQRREDIPALLEHFLQLCRGRHREAKTERFSSDATYSLLRYEWPGNVRELAHVVERAVVLGATKEVSLDALPDSLRSVVARSGPTFGGQVLPMRELQRLYAAWAVAHLGGNKRRTAEKLNVDQKTLGRLLAAEEDSGSTQ